jgi:hypothetical protein
MKDSDEKIVCTRCIHYYVTWDKDFPYGCRAMGFKSKNASMVVVYQSSGMPCQRFEVKAAKKKRK